MNNRLGFVLCFIAAFSIAVAAQNEPTLNAVNLPKYPPLARQARIEGAVTVTFTLPAKAAEPTNVEVVSGHPLLKGAAMENVKTWKFENPYPVERKYETTFTYRLSGIEVPQPTNAIVTFKSFHQVDIVSDLAKPTISD